MRSAPASVSQTNFGHPPGEVRKRVCEVVDHTSEKEGVMEVKEILQLTKYLCPKGEAKIQEGNTVRAPSLLCVGRLPFWSPKLVGEPAKSHEHVSGGRLF